MEMNREIRWVRGIECRIFSECLVFKLKLMQVNESLSVYLSKFTFKHTFKVTKVMYINFLLLLFIWTGARAPFGLVTGKNIGMQGSGQSACWKIQLIQIEHNWYSISVLISKGKKFELKWFYWIRNSFNAKIVKHEKYIEYSLIPFISSIHIIRWHFKWANKCGGWILL